MPASYSFTADWSVPAPLPRVAAVLVDLEHYPDWWPQVRAVASLGPDTARVIVRSSLPYTLDLVLDAVSTVPPTLEVAIGGDLDGHARWRLEQHDEATAMHYEQEVEVGGALAAASRVARPLLTWNHRRMMLGCEAGLRRALAGDERTR